MASIFNLFNNNNAQDAANAQIAAINQGQTAALGSLNQGLTTATNTANAGVAPTLTNLATDQAGQTQYANALGLNGTAGSQSAVANWQATNTAYQAILDQGTPERTAKQGRNRTACERCDRCRFANTRPEPGQFDLPAVFAKLAAISAAGDGQRWHGGDRWHCFGWASK